MQTLRWMRMFGDTIFAIGAVVFVWFALKLMLTKGENVTAPDAAPTDTRRPEVIPVETTAFVPLS